MSTANDDAEKLRADYERLLTVEDLLADITESAWTSIERKEFADSAAEFAKLDQVKPALQTVRAEAREAWNRSFDAALGKERADKIRAQAAAQVEAKRVSRIERSR
ncbi:hypothetical protein [Nocardia cyriacigeorgica]|uniref:hypothetical protein n=1 Tax=Nocardia cyriacigeorgica TaxID=135487 RepID=UPI0024578758|nr:hypothetical protein [Nocardia cyriacigeorgica]